MKTNKRIKFICVLLCLTFFLAGCKNPYQYYLHPSNQPSTTWRSEDGSITFRISEDNSFVEHGIMEVDGQNLDITIYMVPNECWAGIYLTSVAGTIPYHQITEPPIEEWHSTVISAKTFRVEIRESTYFQKGQKIVFHRVDE